MNQQSAGQPLTSKNTVVSSKKNARDGDLVTRDEKLAQSDQPSTREKSSRRKKGSEVGSAGPATEEKESFLEVGLSFFIVYFKVHFILKKNQLLLMFKKYSKCKKFEV